MPLKSGYSRKTFNENLKQLLSEGYGRSMSLRICYEKARQSLHNAHPQGALPKWLTPQSGKRMKNPVPPSSRVGSRESRIQAAGKLYSDFSGHQAKIIMELDKPEYPDVALVVGDIDFVGYTTIRDGVTEKYIHEFKKDCRPLFVVSHDGKQLLMLGGSYDFTERGIVDRRK